MSQFKPQKTPRGVYYDEMGTRRVSYRQRRANSITGALLFAILFLVVILIALFAISQRNRMPEDTDPYPSSPEVTTGNTGSEALSDSQDTTAETTAPPAPAFEIRSVSNDQIHRGELILINGEHPFVFPDSQPQTLFYGNRSTDENGKSLYGLSRADISLNTELFSLFDGMIADFARETGCKDVLITSGYRTYAFQEELYNTRVATQGEEKARMYVAKPGYSEHHAGLAVDMVIFTGGQQYYFTDYKDAAWIVENAPDYGFIWRYTEEKKEITGCASEPWHYRYIGAPHARLCTDLGYCFEEYHAYLKEYTWEGDRLLIAEDGTVSVTDGMNLPESGYMIYTVPANTEGDTTEIPVPPGADCRISGDNAGGFIVTVLL